MQPVASFSIKFSEKFFFGKPQKHLQPGFRSSQAANGIKSVQRTAGVALPFMPDCSLTAQGFRLCSDCFFTKCRRIVSSLPDRESQIGGRAAVIHSLSTAAGSVPGTGRVMRLPPVSPVCRLRNWQNRFLCRQGRSEERRSAPSGSSPRPCSQNEKTIIW